MKVVEFFSSLSVNGHMHFAILLLSVRRFTPFPHMLATSTYTRTYMNSLISPSQLNEVHFRPFSRYRRIRSTDCGFCREVGPEGFI